MEYGSAGAVKHLLLEEEHFSHQTFGELGATVEQNFGARRKLEIRLVHLRELLESQRFLLEGGVRRYWGVGEQFN